MKLIEGYVDAGGRLFMLVDGFEDAAEGELITSGSGLSVTLDGRKSDSEKILEFNGYFPVQSNPLCIFSGVKGFENDLRTKSGMSYIVIGLPGCIIIKSLAAEL